MPGDWEPPGLTSETIQRRFLDHFIRRGHTEVPSASLVADDPTLLLVNAGMVPFKPIFLGEQPAPYPRATSVQKCVRTVDIELVGTTSRHASFFQMCGNFSFGDYFKERAIPLAWELVTGAAGFALPADRLWVTVYQDDEEAEDIWTRAVGVDPSRIQRRGREDNFWDMGVPGPSGPCSEIFWDRGPRYGREGGPVADEDRYVEIWNLVFMQYVRGPGSGKDFEILGELPARNIDTGLGLERMATVLQGVDSLYDIDINRPVLDRCAELAATSYHRDPAADVRLRVAADHVRTAVMLIADGVVPGNDGRSYVLRRMLRRAVRMLRLLGVREPALAHLVPVVRDSLAGLYPELVTDFTRIAGYAVAEEESFLATLRAGTTHFDTAVGAARGTGRAVLAGDDAFRLHDTYGFPIDLTLEMAAEAGVTVDEDGFRRLMAEQRARAQADTAAKKAGAGGAAGYREALQAAGPSRFTGYVELASPTRVAALIDSSGLARAASAGQEIGVVLDVTPFYAEGGGQLPDTGEIRTAAAVLEVLDVQRPVADLVVHRCRVVSGEIVPGQEGQATVDGDRRAAISRSHTATHLLHRAVRAALGESATQAGSQNAPGRLRFDVASPNALPPGLLGEVEDEVNAVLARDLAVRAYVTTQAKARELGAMALFGEKYGDEVRVVEVGDYSRELCGGTHVAASGAIGLVSVLGESSIGAGVRRLEALVGLDAFRFLAREHVLVGRLSGLMKSPPAELADRMAETLERLRAVERELEGLRGAALLAGAAELARSSADVEGLAVLAAEAPAGTVPDDLRKLALDVRGRLSHPGVVVLAARGQGRVSLVVAADDAARERGVRAGELVRALAPHLGGRGGGRDDVAQGGGTDPDAVPAMLSAVPAAVREALGARP